MKLLNLVFFSTLVVASQNSANQVPSELNTIVFLGDSITEMGDAPIGFITLIRNAFTHAHSINAPKIINAGVSGNKVTDLQERLDRDVISKKPAVVIIYIGINDVWHYALPGLKGTPINIYESELKNIVNKIKGVGAKVLLCTPTVIGERQHGTNPQDTILDDYSAVSVKVAYETNSILIDLHSAFLNYLRNHNPYDLREGILTVDGVHLNKKGNELVASEILKALSEEKIF
ncbi:MAG: SGNH/GDSL hydrolase family protein [Candidatus Kryptoniota bacterium]